MRHMKYIAKRVIDARKSKRLLRSQPCPRGSANAALDGESEQPGAGSTRFSSVGFRMCTGCESDGVSERAPGAPVYLARSQLSKRHTPVRGHL